MAQLRTETSNTQSTTQVKSETDNTSGMDRTFEEWNRAIRGINLELTHQKTGLLSEASRMDRASQPEVN